MMKQRTLIKDTVNAVGQEVTVYGWVHMRRDHGKLVFLDLRDATGLLQVVCLPDQVEAQEEAKKVRSEYVVSITGLVNARPAKLVNDNLSTGTVELVATKLTIINEAKTPPFELDQDTRAVGEETRLTYRYLDLRTERMARNLRARADVVNFTRNYFAGHNFIEIETPLLTKGTPEGAREFIVPARHWPGHFYVLPQSPQQFKQLLMVAGVERYMQLARCCRDEDQRGDRQAEFTQFDIEMSFVDREDIMQLVEGLMIGMIQELYPTKKLSATPFTRLTYQEAMDKYQSDKPDMRADKNDPDELAFTWVIDIPSFIQSDTSKKLVATHHPFTMAQAEDMAAYPDEPLKWRSLSYDLTLNGFEIWGGSIRIHQADIQRKMFEILGLSEEEVSSRFGHLLEAFSYGVPPHGGMAMGLDRFLAILQNEPNIREVMAFPKTGDNRDLMMGAPSLTSAKALGEAHIQLTSEALAYLKEHGQAIRESDTDLAD